jgi:hypothetical protein
MSVVSFNGVNTNVDIESVHLQEKALAPYPDQQAATRKDPDAVKTAREQADAPVSAIRLMLYTGARHSEITTAKWADFHLNCERPYWLLPAHSTKAKKKHHVVLNQNELGVVLGLTRNGSPYLFPGDSRPSRNAAQTLERHSQSSRPSEHFTSSRFAASLRLHDGLGRHFALHGPVNSWALSGPDDGTLFPSRTRRPRQKPRAGLMNSSIGPRPPAPFSNETSHRISPALPASQASHRQFPFRFLVKTKVSTALFHHFDFRSVDDNLPRLCFVQHSSQRPQSAIGIRGRAWKF